MFPDSDKYVDHRLEKRNDGLELFGIYLNRYEKIFGKKHPYIKREQRDKCIKIIQEFLKGRCDFIELYEEMVNISLKRCLELGKSDGNINAFADPDNLELFYEEAFEKVC